MALEILERILPEEFVRARVRIDNVGPSPANLDRSSTDVSVVNTTTETDLISFTALGGQIIDQRGILIKADGRLTNDLAVGGLPPTPTATFRIYVGATKVWQDSVYVADDATISSPWHFRFEVAAKNADDAQEVYGIVMNSGATNPNTGEGKLSSNTNAAIFGESAEDATADVVIRLTVQLSDADASFECLLRRYVVDLI